MIVEREFERTEERAGESETNREGKNQGAGEITPSRLKILLDAKTERNRRSGEVDGRIETSPKEESRKRVDDREEITTRNRVGKNN